MSAPTHTAHGWWLHEAGAAELMPASPAAGELTAQVLVIGGGYAGMWSAWQLLERGVPGDAILLLEADLCGHGPSGRNGGFCESLWSRLPALRATLGDERARAVGLASAESVTAIGAWCSEHGVDAWFRRGGQLSVATAPVQDAVGRSAAAAARALGLPERISLLTPDEVAARCRTPAFRGGTLIPDDATVQPARLALGLRRVLIERGVRIHERSRVRRLEGGGGAGAAGFAGGAASGSRASGAAGEAGADAAGLAGGAAGGGQAAGVVATTTAGARVRARTAILAINAAARGVRPLRSRLAVTSSHIVLTEPVPDLIDAIGWTNGEGITDGRTFVHYLRTTPDGRVAFGWGGGRIGWGARLGGRIELDREIARTVERHLATMLPALAGARVTDAWGGPIDVGPAHLPQIVSLPGAPVHAVAGFTGNGVGPSHLAARTLAALADPSDPVDLADPDAVARLPLPPLPERGRGRVPPEPLAWLGGSATRAALLRKERLEQQGRAVDPLTRAVVALPRALGIHVGRA